MTDREKLAVLIQESFDDQYTKRGLMSAYHTAADLIANGVTVQEDCKARAEATQECIVGLQEQITEMRKKLEWISVEDRAEPPENGEYICYGYWAGSGNKKVESAEFCGEWNIVNNFVLTHWMPLPEPPEEES